MIVLNIFKIVCLKYWQNKIKQIMKISNQTNKIENPKPKSKHRKNMHARSQTQADLFFNFEFVNTQTHTRSRHTTSRHKNTIFWNLKIQEHDHITFSSKTSDYFLNQIPNPHPNICCFDVTPTTEKRGMIVDDDERN